MPAPVWRAQLVLDRSDIPQTRCYFVLMSFGVGSAIPPIVSEAPATGLSAVAGVPLALSYRCY